jgi:hypothetical protein
MNFRPLWQLRLRSRYPFSTIYYLLARSRCCCGFKRQGRSAWCIGRPYDQADCFTSSSSYRSQCHVLPQFLQALGRAPRRWPFHSSNKPLSVLLFSTALDRAGIAPEAATSPAPMVNALRLILVISTPSNCVGCRLCGYIFSIFAAHPTGEICERALCSALGCGYAVLAPD